MKYKIKIELLSDMCPSSGEAYGSMVDTDIEYDSFGIPYISAKRLKGCLRESAFLLREWGWKVPIEEIFGERGNRRGNLRLGNARVEGYSQYCLEIMQRRNSGDVHPQKVLQFFSYIRTQTAMEDGVAKEGSLRVIRALKKGLIFEAEAEIEDIYAQSMKEICNCTRNMGLNRTRGMGEIEVTFEDAVQKEYVPEGIEKAEKILETKGDEHQKYCLKYQLRLQEPIILKSSDRGQEKTQDYIEGNKMLGILAGRMGNEKYRELTKERAIICSNLYVTDNAERYYPAPASLRMLKDDDSGNIYDLSAGYETGEQTKNLGNTYVQWSEEGIHALNVNTRIKNHHSRPEDKSIGRARGKGEGEFYQISSIMDGQTFAGYILADKRQMKEIVEVMRSMSSFGIGYGSAAEYGKVELIISDTERYTEESERECEEFLVFLASPVVLYNKAGMYTQEVNVLAEEISRILGKNVIPDMDKLYLKYTMIGGWQSMWGKPKQTAWVLDKGTVIIMRTEDGGKVKIPKVPLFIGERNMEGYGEVIFGTVPTKQTLKSGSAREEQVSKKNPDAAESDMLRYLGVKDEEKMLKKAGREDAVKLLARMHRFDREYVATVNKLVFTLSEQKTEEKFRQVAESIKSDSKRKIAERIVKKADDIPECLYMDKEKAFGIYMKAFLLETKYRLRQMEGGKRDE